MTVLQKLLDTSAPSRENIRGAESRQSKQTANVQTSWQHPGGEGAWARCQGWGGGTQDKPDLTCVWGPSSDTYWLTQIFKMFSFHITKESMAFPCSSVRKESACSAGDLDSTPGLLRSPGGGHGNPLKYSCLENPTDRGAWWATVHGVARVGHDLRTKPPPLKTASIYHHLRVERIS